MKYTEIKELINMTDRDSVEAFINGDITDATYAIYTTEDATQAVYDMYEGDEYMLGMFNANFITDYICLDTETIETLQKSEAYDGIGKAIINSGNFEEMMNDYIATDGFGHALASYDGDHEEYGDLIIVRMS